MFAVGDAAYFIGAMKLGAVHQSAGLLADTNIEGVVGTSPAPLSLALALELHVSSQSLPRESLQWPVERADAGCPYSHAMRGTADVVLTLGVRAA